MCVLQVNKSSSDFWNSLKLTWEQCTDLPRKCWPVSWAELNGKVYITFMDTEIAYVEPLMYDTNTDKWSTLPALPCAHSSLVAVPDRKQLLAIGGVLKNNRVTEVSNKVFLWDEANRSWTTPYPNMPTARHRCSSISHGSTVIVAGGVTCWDPWTMTRAVEVLHIKEPTLFTRSHWSVVERLPHVVYEAIPLIISDTLYVTQGYDSYGYITTCNVVTASLPELLQSSNKNTSSSQVWNKLPDMPYSSFSINHYQGRLITFGGGYPIKQPFSDKPVMQSVPLIHIYNPDTRTWDCIGEISHGYSLGKMVHIKENKFLFIGGLTGTNILIDYDNLITTCLIFTLSK